MNRQTKKRVVTKAETETYLRSALGLKKIVRDGKSIWIRDPSESGPRLQYGASTTTR